MPLSPVQPGEAFGFTLENSRPPWLLQLTSFIVDPVADSTMTAGPVTVGGFAFNDGAARLESVEVSVDRGGLWRSATLDVPTVTHAWVPWSIEADLGSGAHEIWSRATDRLGRTKPLDGRDHWNPNGYERNGVAKVEVAVLA